MSGGTDGESHWADGRAPCKSWFRCKGERALRRPTDAGVLLERGAQLAEEVDGADGDGTLGFTHVGTDSHYRIKVEELREAIAADRAASLKPICIVATAGTVNTGATDDLPAIADLL